jgi:hypothetical protein
MSYIVGMNTKAELDRIQAKALRERADDLWEEAKQADSYEERERLKQKSTELHRLAADLEKSAPLSRPPERAYRRAKVRD